MKRGDYRRDVAVKPESRRVEPRRDRNQSGQGPGGAGAEVWGLSRSPKEGPWRFTNSLEEAQRGASAAVCALPLTKHTRGLVRYEHLALMLEDAVFVNVGRAEVVDREGVLRILRERPSLIFASDVWWAETTSPKMPSFFALPNVVATPRVAEDTATRRCGAAWPWRLSRT
jgi:lactate dehydrogenase-like 2-hydroxyacid dehydrogenase